MKIRATPAFYLSLTEGKPLPQPGNWLPLS